MSLCTPALQRAQGDALVDCWKGSQKAVSKRNSLTSWSMATIAWYYPKLLLQQTHQKQAACLMILCWPPYPVWQKTRRSPSSALSASGSQSNLSPAFCSLEWEIHTEEKPYCSCSALAGQYSLWQRSAPLLWQMNSQNALSWVQQNVQCQALKGEGSKQRVAVKLDTEEWN